MADRELVIKIPEEVYEALRKTYLITNGQRSGKTLMSVIYNAIANGKPLPKGRGRLIDEKILLRKLRSRNFGFNLPTWVKVAIDNTPTIIEADKEEV